MQIIQPDAHTHTHTRMNTARSSNSTQYTFRKLLSGDHKNDDTQFVGIPFFFALVLRARIFRGPETSALCIAEERNFFLTLTSFKRHRVMSVITSFWRGAKGRKRTGGYIIR